MTAFSWIGQLPWADAPTWVVFVLAAIVMWPGIVGCIHRCQQHFHDRMVLRESTGYVRVHTEYHRFGASSHTVEVDPRNEIPKRLAAEAIPTIAPPAPDPEVRSA